MYSLEVNPSCERLNKDRVKCSLLVPSTRRGQSMFLQPLTEIQTDVLDLVI